MRRATGFRSVHARQPYTLLSGKWTYLFVKKRERRRPHGFCALALLRKWAEKCLKINSILFARNQHSVCWKSAFCFLVVSFGAISGCASGIRPSRHEADKRLGIFKKARANLERLALYRSVCSGCLPICPDLAGVCFVSDVQALSSEADAKTPPLRTFGNTATLRGAVIDAAKVRHFFESTKQFAVFCGSKFFTVHFSLLPPPLCP